MNDYEFGDWQRILFGDVPGSFLLEVFGRTLLMFVVIFVALRATGKRTVRQLSVVELVLIIGLGSAAGDPMFYHDVGMLPALLVFLVVIISYRTLTRLAAKSPKMETLLEGKVICLIDEGKFAYKEFGKEDLGQDEFFMELRSAGIEHLGQVRKAYLETNGSISVYFYEDDRVRAGLPVLPEIFAQRTKKIEQDGEFACTFCGNIDAFVKPVLHPVCSRCGHDTWVKALNTKRVT
ncbi:DUF421 domain-containing protein [Arsenicibacter rosenii]|uniref:YetF C-terminal domain-containing protein n=1 Tax=Arsenicibacter rosenii TaxID=1750698 RepID=A0A1S2VL24_9BACT|nr:DUF421 domain-containing protein [Arsenicibacter rosenii]OIN59471.1 hypothetical protein BLX24_10910 [Arsenicibacter rosenii]